ncbi:MAG TPA: outer membrane beta-barrel protein, partial [Candidatus Baltobacteraceae bacterium]
MLALLTLIVLAQAAPSAPPAASPTPAPAAPPAVSVSPDFALYDLYTSGIPGGAADVSDALLNFNASAGKLHANATVGDYSFPVVGFPLAPDNAPGANVMLYSPLPVAAFTYQFNSHVSVGIGKFGSLLGQESPFTYQNLNVQRGLGWNMEPAISRGVQVAYANGPWNASVREDDAYYSGSGRAVEGLIGWSPSANTSLQFAAMIPGRNLPPNITTAVGNKSEYDLMYARTAGKLQLLPY